MELVIADLNNMKIMKPKTVIDMWYGDKFEPMKYGADAFFSDCDCVYRGNIYDDAGKMIGDYVSPDSVWIEKNFKIKWNGEGCL